MIYKSDYNGEKIDEILAKADAIEPDPQYPKNPQINFKVTNNVNEILFNTINDKPFSDFNFTSYRVIVELPEKPAISHSSEFKISPCIQTATEGNNPYIATTGFFESGKHLWFGGGFDLLNSFSWCINLAGNSGWRGNIVSQSNVYLYDSNTIKGILFQSVNSAVPIRDGVTIKVWLK